MKIAIQGHFTRGKEVIQILESLGGVNACPLYGDSINSHYYIDPNHKNMICCHDRDYINKYCKKYTLEEFEKEYPFKVGDRVISMTTNFIGTITNLKENGYYYIKYDNVASAFSLGKNLKPYTEMKEERNIKLTLEKAKEWYKKGGELKEIALQAFSEQELTKTNLPKNWEEFCINFPMKNGECYVNTCCDITMELECLEGRDIKMDRNVCPSRKSAEAHLAMIQLEQLRDCWRQGNVPQGVKYKIRKVKNKFTITFGEEDSFLSFYDRKVAEEFLECFRDLIEQAGDLI